MKDAGRRDSTSFPVLVILTIGMNCQSCFGRKDEVRGHKVLVVARLKIEEA
jgi:hypothetical protein